MLHTLKHFLIGLIKLILVPIFFIFWLIIGIFDIIHDFGGSDFYSGYNQDFTVWFYNIGKD